MNNKAAFARALSNALDAIGYTGHGRQKAVAEVLDASPQAVSNWLNPDHPAYPRVETIMAIARLTGVSAGALFDQGKDGNSLFSLTAINTSRGDKITIGNAQHLPLMFGVLHGQALLIEDESMISAVGGRLSFYPGSIVICDLDNTNPRSGDLVLAKVNDQLLFRKYVIDSSMTYLMPLNPTYQNFNGQYTIVGTFAYMLLTA